MEKKRREKRRKRKKWEEKGKKEKKSIRGRIMTKSATERGKKDIFSPNLYSTNLGKIQFRKGGGRI